MDGGADALNGTIWFPNTPSPPYEQLSPVRQNRCDPIATQHVSFTMFLPSNNGIISLVLEVERDASRRSFSLSSREGKNVLRISSTRVNHISQFFFFVFVHRALVEHAIEPILFVQLAVCESRLGHVVVALRAKPVKLRAIHPVN